MSEHKLHRTFLQLCLMESLAGCSSPAESAPADAPAASTAPAETAVPAQEAAQPQASEYSSFDEVYHKGDTVTAHDFTFTITDT